MWEFDVPLPTSSSPSISSTGSATLWLRLGPVLFTPPLLAKLPPRLGIRLPMGLYRLTPLLLLSSLMAEPKENACKRSECFFSGGWRYFGRGISCGLYMFSGQSAYSSSFLWLPNRHLEEVLVFFRAFVEDAVGVCASSVDRVSVEAEETEGRPRARLTLARKGIVKICEWRG